jgi:hypothetical protein
MNPLFAQQEHPDIGLAVLLGAAVVAALLLLVLIPSAVVLRAAQRRREIRHIERMRMLDAGLPIPARDGSDAARAAVCIAACIAIGAVVPVLSFVFTWFGYASHPDAADEMWIAPMVVSVAAVISSAVLAGYLFGRGGPSAPGADALASGAGAAQPNGQAAKPPLDPDAYDVAGRRG